MPLLKDTMGYRFAADPDRKWLMYDQIAIASIISCFRINR